MHDDHSPTAIGIVGIGKIARDQHLLVLVMQSGFTLAACASLHSCVDGLPRYTTLNAILVDEPMLQAVSLCTPPQVWFAQAHAALAAGKHVILRKPPGTSVLEVVLLAELARQYCCMLLVSQHSCHASGVETARGWLARQAIVPVNV